MKDLIPCPLFKRVPWHHVCPWGWGNVYEDLSRRETVLAPVPLNVIFKWIHGLWVWMHDPHDWQITKIERH